MRALIRTPLAVAFACGSPRPGGGSRLPCRRPRCRCRPCCPGCTARGTLRSRRAAGCCSRRRTGPSGSVTRNGAFVRTLADPIDSIVMGEGGMMGVAVDPSFQSNRRVYTCFLSNLRWRARRAGRAVADERGRHRAHRPRRHRHRDPRDLGTPLRVPDAVRSRRSALDRYRRCRQPHGAPEPAPRWAARCCASTPAAKACRATPSPPSTRGSTPTATATCRASPSAPAATPTPSSTATGRDDEVNRLVAGSNYGWDPRPLSGQIVLRRVPADDRHRSASGRPRGGVVVGGPHHRALGRRLHAGPRGGLGRLPRDGGAEGSAAPRPAAWTTTAPRWSPSG